eukprot:Pgem_evm1s9260
MCYLSRTEGDSVERFLVYECKHHFNFACLVIWTLDSQVRDDTAPDISSYCSEFKE